MGRHALTAGNGIPEGAATPLFLYDGSCSFCTNRARRLQVTNPRLRIIPADSIDDATLLRVGLDRSALQAEACLIDGDGNKHLGHRAITAALREAGSWRAILGRMLDTRLIAPIVASIYRLVARNRHRL